MAQLAASTYFATALGILTAPVVARALGPEGRGAYAAVMVYSTMTALVLGLGISLAVTRALQVQLLSAAAVFGACLRFSAATLPLAVAAGFGIAAVALNSSGATVRAAVVVFCAMAPITLLQICLISFLLSRGSLRSLAIVRTLPLVLNAVGVVALALLGWLTIVTYLVVTAIGIVVTLALTVRAVGERPKGGVEVRGLLRFGIRAYPLSLANLANGQLDQLLIAPFLGLTDLGHYAVAVTLSGAPNGLVQAVASRAVSEMTDPRGALLVRGIEARIRSVVVISGLSGLLLAAIVPVGVPVLFGPAFAATTPLCLILLTAAPAQAISLVAGTALILGGRPGTASAAHLGGLAATAIGLAVALPLIGVLGAAIVSSVAYWAVATTMLVSLRRDGVVSVAPRWADVVVVAGYASRLRRK